MSEDQQWFTRDEILGKLGIHKSTLHRRVTKGLVDRKTHPQNENRRLYRPLTSHVPETSASDDGGIPILLSPSEKSGFTRDYHINVRDFIEELNEAVSEMKARPTQGLRPVLNGTSLCILLSDIHLGKQNQYYSPLVATMCIDNIVDQIMQLCLPDDLSEIVFILAGDLVEGEDIYPRQAHHTSLPAILQVTKLVRALARLFTETSITFRVPVRIETVPGNHGRVSKTSDAKTNWDNIAYEMLAVAFDNSQADVTINVNLHKFLTFQVQDKTGVANHNGVKHTGTATMLNKLNGWLVTKHWDFFCHGHWHKLEYGSLYGKLVVKNGSMCGQDDLGEDMGVYSPPRQAYFLVRHGKPISSFGFLEFNHANF